MKKVAVFICLAVALLALAPAPADAKVNRQPGGIPAFFIGCCWGLREGTEWNEGADLHWREWMRIVPYVNIVFALWDAIECGQGMTAHDWAAKNGANWY